jgi:hypothetical protein
MLGLGKYVNICKSVIYYTQGAIKGICSKKGSWMISPTGSQNHILNKHMWWFSSFFLLGFNLYLFFHKWIAIKFWFDYVLLVAKIWS